MPLMTLSIKYMKVVSPRRYEPLDVGPIVDMDCKDGVYEPTVYTDEKSFIIIDDVTERPTEQTKRGFMKWIHENLEDLK